MKTDIKYKFLLAPWYKSKVVGHGMEKKDSCSLNGIRNWYNLFGNPNSFQMRYVSYRNSPTNVLHMRMFMVTFVLVKFWKQLKCLLIGDYQN